jgi:hypothetical protein
MSDNVRIVNLSTYTSPVITEQKNKEWVEYGHDNNYYQYLIDLFYGSPTNNAAIKGIANLIYGKGLEVVKGDRNLTGYLNLMQVFADPNVLRNCALDLKAMGECAIQLVKSKDKTQYIKANHWAIQTLRPEKCNENGEIEGYYFCSNWAELKRGQKPKRFSAFGFDEADTECIFVIKPYAIGSYYFSPPDYQGGSQWAEIECEIGNYHLNNIKNGMAPSMLINFNNGQPSDEIKNLIEAQIKAKFGGSSNAGKVIIAFNDNAESKADITPVQLSDAHNQYTFLSNESMQKIMLAHRITSPMLLGIKDNSGLGNNADEIKNASILFDNTVIRPFQELLLDAVKQIMYKNGYTLDVYFKTLQPLEFTDLSGKNLDEATTEKEIGLSAVKLTSNTPVTDMTDSDEQEWLDYLKTKGETLSTDWELVSEEPVTDAESEIQMSKFELFKRFAEPNEKSKDDKGIYLMRYRYAPMQNGSNSRQFCRDMVSNAKLGVVYRREDIVTMGEDGINGKFAPSGKSNYSIWQFKGGVNCNHQWYRLTYRRKQVNGKIVPLSESEKATQQRDIEENYKRVSSQSADALGVPFNPPDWQEASTKTIDLPNKGSLKNK